MSYQPSMSAVLSCCSRVAGEWTVPTRSILLLFALSFLVSGCSNSNERANKLFVEAIAALEGMKDSQTSTRADKLVAWRKTSDLLDKIIKDFPGSEIAVQLVQNKVIIEGKSLSEFRALPERLKENWCSGQLKRTGLAALVWANDHNDTLPRTYSELIHAVGGVPPDTNNTALADLVCPKAATFDTKTGIRKMVVQPEEIERIGYTVVRLGLKGIESDETKTWLRCLACGHELHVDGSVHKK